MLCAAVLGVHAFRAADGRACARWSLAALAPLALIGTHFLWLRGVAGGYLLAGDTLLDLVRGVPANALERLRALGAGWMPASAFLVLVTVACVIGAARGRAGSVTLLLGWTLASCIPFGLFAGSRYRDYPSQAPVALLLAFGLELALSRRGRAASLALRTPVLMLPLVLLGLRRRAEVNIEWRAATREIEQCLDPLRALREESPGKAPVLVNLEVSARQLVVHEYGLSSIVEVQTLAFLDHASGYVATPGLALALEGDTPLFGRRHDGSVGRMERGYFERRPVLASMARVERAVAVDSREAALARLAAGVDDLGGTCVVEAPAHASTAIPALSGGATGTFAVLEPFTVERQSLQAHAVIEVTGPGPALIAVREPLLWADSLRFGPEYARLGRVLDPRVVRLAASVAGGKELPVWWADGFGFAVLAPAGEPGAHRIELTFSLAPSLPVGD